MAEILEIRRATLRDAAAFFGFIEEGRLAKHSRKSYGYEGEMVMAVCIGSDE